jgi:hypothetical protein
VRSKGRAFIGRSLVRDDDRGGAVILDLRNKTDRCEPDEHSGEQPKVWALVAFQQDLRLRGHDCRESKGRTSLDSAI